MVEEIIDDIVTERLSNVHNTLGPSASEYGVSSPLGRENPFGYGSSAGKGRAIRLG